MLAQHETKSQLTIDIAKPITQNDSSLITTSSQKPVCLRNTQDELLTLTDTLHTAAVEPSSGSCSSRVCQGSMMRQLPSGGDKSFTRTKTQVWSDAQKFLYEYYEQFPTKLQVLYKQTRLESVCNEILIDGTYEQTKPELMYGAQLAWRNASRCIGRIQWSNLQFLDARSVQSSLDMFEAVCDHLRAATNNGIIRSTITVFSPSSIDGRATCRIWSPQFISYAGYSQSDGTILGDPANVQLTQLCVKLGWTPPEQPTEFDILPLVLQYGDEDPYFFHLPDDLLLQVKIHHPKYPGLELLALKWYALPAVSNMLLDCGGVVYPACGFNGWYMSTEIVRDLCDSSRYNKLRDIADSVGLDTNQPSVYWKDMASVILNIAIIYSFQEQGVTIVDHHTASDSFMSHFSNETKLRGGCPADWIWINPPIGGALTKVHHQEMLNYKLKPSFEYQCPAWVHHTWRIPRKVKRRISLRSVARSINILAHFMNGALSKRRSCVILYASETGTAEQYAYSLQLIFNQSFNSKVYSMKSYDYTGIKFETLVLIVAATTGNGEPPENGRLFVEMTDALIGDKNSKTINNVSAAYKVVQRQGSLNHDNPMYAVFGLGSSAYPHFCAFAKKIDEIMRRLDCLEVLPISLGDAIKNQQSSFSTWSRKVYNAACKTLCIYKPPNECDLDTISEHSNGLKLQTNRIVSVTESVENICRKLSDVHKREVQEFSTVSVTTLSTKNASKEYMLVELTALSAIKYRPGDHIAVFPVNNSSDVDFICERVVFPTDVTADSQISVETLDDPHGNSEWKRPTRLPISSMRSLLTYFIDIRAPPTQQFLELLIADDNVTTTSELTNLREILQDDSIYQERIIDQRCSLCDLLRSFPSIRLPANLMLTQLPTLKPRYYSISSSPQLHPSQVHITAAVVEYAMETKDGVLHHHRGLCTTWMRQLQPNQIVRAYIKRSPDFHLPPDITVPLILIGPGSGIAPFRGFWQHLHGIRSCGDQQPEVHLYFGCRTPAEQLYREEIEHLCTIGVITSYHVAYSQNQSHPKAYVQDKLQEHRHDIRRLVMKKGAHIYVCGDVRMANDVQTVLSEILSSCDIKGNHIVQNVVKNEGNHKVKKAYVTSSKNLNQLSIIEVLKEGGRYHEDIYGITS